MPRAFGFDGDSAYYESLEKKVLADEQKRRETEAEAVKERRRSLGLPEGEKLSRKDKKILEDATGVRSLSERRRRICCSMVVEDRSLRRGNGIRLAMAMASSMRGIPALSPVLSSTAGSLSGMGHLRS